MLFDMTSELARYKSMLDDTANYNKTGLLQAQKKAYQPQIQFSQRIDRHNQNNFAIKQLEISFVQSVTLKDDPKFKQIQKLFQKYNAEASQKGEVAVDGMHLKTVVMDSMLKFLRMAMLAPDGQTKLKLVHVAHGWLMKHLKPREYSSRRVLLGSIKETVQQTGLLPEGVIDQHLGTGRPKKVQTLPSQTIEDEMRDYLMQARTVHKQIQAPSHQLQQYHTHQVGYLQHHHEQLPEIKKKNPLLRVKFNKPNLDQYYLPSEPGDPTPPAEPNLEIVPPSTHQELQPPPVLEGGESAEPAEPAGNPQAEGQIDILDQLGGDPDPDDGEDQPQEYQQEKKGKLDPLVKIFALKDQQQREKLHTFNYPSINNLERYRMQYKEMMKRSDQQFEEQIKEWTAQKARIKTEASRRQAATRPMTLLNKTTQHNAYHQSRINETIRKAKPYLAHEHTRETLNVQVGLSRFDRGRAKTQTSGSAPKPISAILQENKRTNGPQDLMAQMQQIKNKFARHKIFTSLNAMRGGLMHPQDKQEGEKQQHVEYPTNLISNPFFVVKKKKKPKKKR